MQEADLGNMEVTMNYLFALLFLFTWTCSPSPQVPLRSLSSMATTDQDNGIDDLDRDEDEDEDEYEDYTSRSSHKNWDDRQDTPTSSSSKKKYVQSYDPVLKSINPADGDSTSDSFAKITLAGLDPKMGEVIVYFHRVSDLPEDSSIEPEPEPEDDRTSPALIGECTGKMSSAEINPMRTYLKISDLESGIYTISMQYASGHSEDSKCIGLKSGYKFQLDSDSDDPPDGIDPPELLGVSIIDSKPTLRLTRWPDETELVNDCDSLTPYTVVEQTEEDDGTILASIDIVPEGMHNFALNGSEECFDLGERELSRSEESPFAFLTPKTLPLFTKNAKAPDSFIWSADSPYSSLELYTERECTNSLALTLADGTYEVWIKANYKAKDEQSPCVPLSLSYTVDTQRPTASELIADAVRVNGHLVAYTADNIALERSTGFSDSSCRESARPIAPAGKIYGMFSDKAGNLGCVYMGERKISVALIMTILD